MITRRMRRRRRLLDTYVRVELEERGALLGERLDGPQEMPLHPPLRTGRRTPPKAPGPETADRPDGDWLRRTVARFGRWERRRSPLA